MSLGSSSSLKGAHEFAAASELTYRPKRVFARLHLCKLFVPKAVRRHHNKDLLEHLMTSLKTTAREEREREREI